MQVAKLHSHSVMMSDASRRVEPLWYYVDGDVCRKVAPRQCHDMGAHGKVALLDDGSVSQSCTSAMS